MDGPDRQLSAVMQAGFAEQRRHVILDSAVRQAEAVSDLAVSGTDAQQPQDVQIALGERLASRQRRWSRWRRLWRARQPRRCTPGAQPTEQLTRDARLKWRLATVNGSD